MQDIRALAAVVASKKDDPELELLAHAVLRSYGVDLLLSLAAAIRPTTPAEQAAVTWLAGEIHKVAALIPEAKRLI